MKSTKVFSLLCLGLGACSYLKAPQPATVANVYRDADEDNVARITVTAVNVMRWEQIQKDLANARLALNQDALQTSAFIATSAGSRTTTDLGSAGFSATINGPSISRQEATSVDSSGTTTHTSSDTRSTTTPSVPSAASPLTPSTGATVGQATIGTFSPNIDTASRIRLEAALSEGIVEINRRYDSIPIQPGYVPYFVDLLVSVDPLNRHQPYDTTITIDFCINPQGNSQQGNTCVPGAKHLYVIPLESSEALEGEQQQVASNIVRQLSLQVGAQAQSVSVNASLQKILADIAQQEYLNLNSLSLPVQNGSTGLAVRLGANQAGNHFEMIPRTHSVTLVLLVPREYVAQGSNKFEVAMEGRAHYRDPDHPENAPIRHTKKSTDIQFSVFPLTLSETLACPPAQSVLALTPTPTAGGFATTAMTLNGASSLLYRRIRSAITVPRSKGLPAVTFVSAEAIHNNESLVFLYPDVSKFVRSGSELHLQVLQSSSGDEAAFSCPDTGGYPIAVPPSAAAAPKPKGNPTKVKVAKAQVKAKKV